MWEFSNSTRSFVDSCPLCSQVPTTAWETKGAQYDMLISVVVVMVVMVVVIDNNITMTKVRCGEWDTQTTSEPRAHQDRYVADVAIHPEFNSRWRSYNNHNTKIKYNNRAQHNKW